MEYVDGVDLSKLSRRLGPLSIADACELVRQCAVGLQHAHEHGLVHRDIKPSNLMLSCPPAVSAGEGQGEGTQPILKILDLGLARLHNAQHDDLTSAGQMMGTIDYMAPEQTGDSHDVDIRADIYSLGATLYKLLAGCVPYFDPKYDTVVKKLAALANEPITPIGQYRPDVPDELATVLHQMLEKEAGDRPVTPNEIVAAIAPHAEGADLVALMKRYHEPDGNQAVRDSASLHSTSQYLTSSFTGTTPSGGSHTDGAGSDHTTLAPSGAIELESVVSAVDGQPQHTQNESDPRIATRRRIFFAAIVEIGRAHV